MLEESEEEPEMALEPVPEVVPEEVLVEGAMITTRGGSFPIPWCTSGVLTDSLRSCCRGRCGWCCSGTRGGPGASPLYTSDDIPPYEAMSTAHRALSQVQRVLRREGEGLADKRRHLQLWATILKETTVFERAAARARQRSFNLQVEAVIFHP
jgi:hypothetical protein